MSAVPNVWIAHSLTGPGVRLITAVPTAVRASAAGEKNTARQLGHAEGHRGCGDAGAHPQTDAGSGHVSQPTAGWDPHVLPVDDER